MYGSPIGLRQSALAVRKQSAPPRITPVGLALHRKEALGALIEDEVIVMMPAPGQQYRLSGGDERGLDLSL